jgi:hypothetical protein
MQRVVITEKAKKEISIIILEKASGGRMPAAAQDRPHPPAGAWMALGGIPGGDHATGTANQRLA